ncbi:family 16 glycosylhydrolase [Colwellia psychrerythraea]|uniref:Beta-glucanase n=1 Tax=Colwellia psychrerythraea TaxID=28229 RepID=A0A099KE72_COLPS|nr:family 16 glycosylhydrolase [Colwellia psychrerythraea]KGJ88606.1 glycoside hydrolase family 16 [Colwellia psychrerythraea]
MNHNNKRTKFVQIWWKLRNNFLRALTKKRCAAFSAGKVKEGLRSIEKIYVINLDRQQGRLTHIKKELSRVTERQKKPLTTLLHRITAVDALSETNNQITAEVKSEYTLQEQLFVDPCQALPQQLNLDMKIKMSKQEVAVACSHIKVWKRIANGDEEYSLVLEDDVSLHPNFAALMEKSWSELSQKSSPDNNFDILFLSFQEVDMGAEKVKFTPSTFKLFRGIWYMSGYVLSKQGANKLLSMLPIVGPVDLWINHKFNILNAIMNNKSIIPQRSDEVSSNFYSILPILSKIGVLNDGAPSYFKSAELNKPIFATGIEGSELTSLAMSLSMLGYRCCSDIYELPDEERISLLNVTKERIFDAYVNVACLENEWKQLAKLYPNAQMIVFQSNFSQKGLNELKTAWGTRLLLLDEQNCYQWKDICEFLNVVPPVSPYPKIEGIPKRKVEVSDSSVGHYRWLDGDESPWVIDRKNKQFEYIQSRQLTTNKPINDSQLDNTRFWYYRDDTFPGNECLFSPANLQINSRTKANFVARKENMEVRQYSSSAITSHESFLYGKFEAELKPPKVSGLVTGVFLHRDSPRQEIDIEFVGNKPTKMLTNVYYNPGVNGARFDYGYRGTPFEIELGFDATKEFHRYSIEWSENEIKWFVDDNLVHKRSNWGPTPIPHLPMQFHVNLWPTRSRELAGKIDNSKLPAVMELIGISIKARKCINKKTIAIDKQGLKENDLELENV